MKLFKIALVCLLIMELICASLFVYDLCSFYKNGQWSLFPFMNMQQYKECDGYQSYVEACDYVDSLRESKNNLVLSKITNCVMLASFFCFPIYSVLKLWTKRRLDKLYAALSLMVAIISLAMIIFIRGFLEGSHGDLGAYLYIPTIYATYEDAAKYLLIYLTLLPLAYVYRKEKHS